MMIVIFFEMAPVKHVSEPFKLLKDIKTNFFRFISPSYLVLFFLSPFSAGFLVLSVYYAFTADLVFLKVQIE